MEHVFLALLHLVQPAGKRSPASHFSLVVLASALMVEGEAHLHVSTAGAGRPLVSGRLHDGSVVVRDGVEVAGALDVRVVVIDMWLILKQRVNGFVKCCRCNSKLILFNNLESRSRDISNRYCHHDRPRQVPRDQSIGPEG